MNLEKFCGQIVKQQELDEIVEIIATFPNLSRSELANTFCELFSWKRPTGKLKSVECLQFLERLEEKGIISLPVRKKRANKKRKEIKQTSKTDPRSAITVNLKELLPISLSRVIHKEQRELWYEYVERHHYLGYQIPFGAQLRYFIRSEGINETLGCFQFSSPAWMMAPRDGWIGWNEAQRKTNLQKIINNSRFLIFPWVKVKNLASSVLALAVKIVPTDWYDCYGYRPVLMESLVDQKRFTGTCYKAANWIHVGKTTGRGRMDRERKRKNAAVKEIYLYPLISKFRQELVKL